MSPKWKHCKYPLTVQGRNKLKYAYKMENYAEMKMNKVQLSATIWSKREYIQYDSIFIKFKNSPNLNSFI